MENQTDKSNTEKKTPVNYEEKIGQQTKVVNELSDKYKKNPTEELKFELDRETDLLRHYSNAAKGNPRERAKKAAEQAGKITLNRAIQQVEPEE